MWKILPFNLLLRGQCMYRHAEHQQNVCWGSWSPEIDGIEGHAPLGLSGAPSNPTVYGQTQGRLLPKANPTARKGNGCRPFHPPMPNVQSWCNTAAFNVGWTTLMLAFSFVGTLDRFCCSNKLYARKYFLFRRHLRCYSIPNFAVVSQDFSVVLSILIIDIIFPYYIGTA